MGIGIWELVLIFAIVLVIFGAGRIPTIMKDVGKGIKSLKDGLKEDDSEKKDKKDQ